MSKLFYFISIGILAFWILRCESIAVNDEKMQGIKLSNSGSFSQQILAQVSPPPSSDSTSSSSIPSVEVPEKSNTISNLIKSTDPEEREKFLKQNLSNQSDNTTVSSETILVPTGKDPFSIVPQIPVPELTPEETSVGQLPEVQGQQLPSLPTLPESKAPVAWRQNARRIVPNDQSLELARPRRRRPLSPISPFAPRDSVFIERGC
ncbi:MAG: hypothetical protein AB4080_13895 [Trichodesmium sp.]